MAATGIMTDLPGAIRDMVESYMAESGDDFSSADAMHGRCEDHSHALVRYLDGREAPDFFGDAEPVEAGAVNTWMDAVPEALEGHEMAGGHCIVTVEHDGGRWEIDLTAAQFPEMGWTGPLAREVY